MILRNQWQTDHIHVLKVLVADLWCISTKQQQPRLPTAFKSNPSANRKGITCAVDKSNVKRLKSSSKQADRCWWRIQMHTNATKIQQQQTRCKHASTTSWHLVLATTHIVLLRNALKDQVCSIFTICEHSLLNFFASGAASQHKCGAEAMKITWLPFFLPQFACFLSDSWALCC